MIDLHCHVDLYPDPVALLDEVEVRGTYVLAVTTTPKAWRGTKAMVGERKRVRVALGLHPEVVAQRHREVALLCGLLPECRYVGEIGLDGSPPHRASFAQQTAVFDRILNACEANGGRVMTIHSRGAATAVLDALQRHPAAGTPILHWFSGTAKELERARKLDCWFSVGPAMLRSQKGRDLARLIPVDRLLTETDGPFARDGDKPFVPWRAFDCLPEVAALKGMAAQDLAAQVMSNLRTLLVQSTK